jgi:hypothetical protein
MYQLYRLQEVQRLHELPRHIADALQRQGLVVVPLDQVV